VTERARRIVDRIARGLVLATLAVALVVGVCAFLDGSEAHYPGEVVRHDAGGIFIVLFLAPLLIGGALVWRWTQPRLLWVWTLLGWLAGLSYAAFLTDNRPRSSELLWPLLVVDVGALIAAGLVMFGAPVLAFSMTAASTIPDGSTPVLARRLRLFTVVVAALGLVTSIFGFFPGTRVLDDSNNCFGTAIGALFTEAHSHGCQPSYDRVATTRMAGGLPVLLYVVLALAPAILVRADPRPRRVWQWTLWSFAAVIPAGLMFFVLEFHLDLFARTVTLWPTRVVEAGIIALQLLLIVGLPVLALSARELDPPRPPRAVARQRNGLNV